MSISVKIITNYEKVIAILMLSLIQISTYAQKYKFQRVSRDVKKQAKITLKDGWKTYPSDLPIPQQLNNSFNKRGEIDETGNPKLMVGRGRSVAQTMAAAEFQALELAKNEIVKQMEANINIVINGELSNNQINKNDAASITKQVSLSTNTISKKLGRTINLVKMYKENLETYEVDITIGYDTKTAKTIMIDEIKASLGAEADKLRTTFESFLNPDKSNKN